jgi:hypothetical protein
VLVLLRGSSAIASRLAARFFWLIACCELFVAIGILVQLGVVQKYRYEDSYPYVSDLREPFRRPVERQLKTLPGEHLVVVRYSKDHNSGEEYVYNGADIDRAKIVWAREISAVDISPLLNYFRNRKVWLYEPDEDDSVVRPYDATGAGW